MTLEQKGGQQIQSDETGKVDGHCIKFPVDPIIQARMPSGTRTFVEESPIEVIINGIKKLLGKDPNSLG